MQKSISSYTEASNFSLWICSMLPEVSKLGFSYLQHIQLKKEKIETKFHRLKQIQWPGIKRSNVPEIRQAPTRVSRFTGNGYF